MEKIISRALFTANELCQMNIDDFFMERAFRLAWKAAGKTSPNPLVGAVLVEKGRIIAEGVHERAGKPHAEIVALDKAGSLARGATLYVNIEPCCHFGKTPPCTDRIIEAGIGRVVISTKDPYKEVFGLGVEKLKQNDIHVDSGVKKEKAMLLNLPYFNRILSEDKAVTILLKIALSLDGKVSASVGHGTAITSQEAKIWTYKMRAQTSGILVGIETLLIDKPQLDCRGYGDGRNPIPVILDTFLRFPLDHKWLSKKKDFYIFCGGSPDSAKLEKLKNSSARVIPCSDKDGFIDLEEVLHKLAAEGLTTVLVEGGARVFSSFVSTGIWDALYVLTASKLIGGKGVPLFCRKEPVDLETIAAGSEFLGEDLLSCFISRKTMERIAAKLH